MSASPMSMPQTQQGQQMQSPWGGGQFGQQRGGRRRPSWGQRGGFGQQGGQFGQGMKFKQPSQGEDPNQIQAFGGNMNWQQEQAGGSSGSQMQPFNSGGQGQGQSGSPVTPFGSNYVPSRQDLSSGGFLGGQGNVRYDPYSGAEIPREDRVKPGRYISDQLAMGPAVQDAMNFSFTDLPQNYATGAAQGLVQQGQQLGQQGSQMLGQGQQYLQQGNDFTQQGVQNILGANSAVQQAAGNATQNQEQAQAQLQSLQQKALSPNLDPQQRQMFQNMADQSRANINARFQEGGDIYNQFDRQGAADQAQLAASGVLDSTTAGNVIGRRQADFASNQANLLAANDQQMNQNILDERNRIGTTATNFGGLQGGQASNQAGILANLLGQQGSNANNIGQLGIAQQGVGNQMGSLGAQLAGLGLQGQNMGGELSLNDRGQEADMQLAQQGQRLLGNQTALQNLQSLQNNRFNRKMTRAEFEQQMQMYQDSQQGQGWFSQIADPFNVMPY